MIVLKRFIIVNLTVLIVENLVNSVISVHIFCHLG